MSAYENGLFEAVGSGDEPDWLKGVPDVVPLLAFDAIDFVEAVLDVTPTDWQKRILIDQFGAGPEPTTTPDGVEP